MHIVRLTANNIKRLRAIAISPDGNIVEIRGKNGEGKTSVLDAIAYALGGVRLCPAEPIRHGQPTASVTIDLGELKVRRKWTQKSSTLTVTNADGVPAKSPQAVLDKLVGALTFDPLEFIRMDDAKQWATLIALKGIGKRMAEIKVGDDAQRAHRLKAGLVKKECEAAARQIVFPTDTPAEPISITALTGRLEQAREVIEANNRARRDVLDAENDRDALGRKVEHADGDIKAKQREIRLLETERERIATEYSNQCNAVIIAKASCEKLADPQLQPIRDEIEQAETINRNVELRHQRAQYAPRIIEATKIIDAAQFVIDAFQTERQDLLTKGEFPVEGLSFGEIGVRFDGIPFDQCSAAEQLRVSVAMGMKMNPKLSVLLIRDGSLLDADSLKVLYAMVTANDYQLWIERVGDDGETGIVIEDGAVAGVHTGDSTPREHPPGEAMDEHEMAVEDIRDQDTRYVSPEMAADARQPEREEFTIGPDEVGELPIIDGHIAGTEPPKPEDDDRPSPADMDAS